MFEHLSEWDMRFINLAYHVASWSKDPRTKVGAVLVLPFEKRKIALGYNGFPPNVPDRPEWLCDRPKKNLLTQHAERNVLDNAQFDTGGATLYTTKPICPECAKSAISKGVARVVQPDVEEDPAWTDHAKNAVWILQHAEVLVDPYDWRDP